MCWDVLFLWAVLGFICQTTRGSFGTRENESVIASSAFKCGSTLTTATGRIEYLPSQPGLENHVCAWVFRFNRAKQYHISTYDDKQNQTAYHWSFTGFTHDMTTITHHHISKRTNESVLIIANIVVATIHIYEFGLTDEHPVVEYGMYMGGDIPEPSPFSTDFHFQAEEYDQIVRIPESLNGTSNQLTTVICAPHNNTYGIMTVIEVRSELPVEGCNQDVIGYMYHSILEGWYPSLNWCKWGSFSIGHNELVMVVYRSNGAALRNNFTISCYCANHIC